MNTVKLSFVWLFVVLLVIMIICLLVVIHRGKKDYHNFGGESWKGKYNLFTYLWPRLVLWLLGFAIVFLNGIACTVFYEQMIHLFDKLGLLSQARDVVGVIAGVTGMVIIFASLISMAFAFLLIHDSVACRLAEILLDSPGMFVKVDWSCVKKKFGA